jgi:type I restriction enzyme, S subunit
VSVREGYKQTEIGIIPEGWEVAKLGEILNVQTGKKNAQDAIGNGEYPFFTRSVDTQRINTYSHDTESLFIAGEGNFAVKYYNGKFDIHQRTYMLTSLKENYVDLKFLQNSIQPRIFKLIATSVGSTVQSLRKPIIQDLQIPLPPLQEQKKIADILSTVDQKIGFIDTQIEQTETLKKGLMQKLLTEGIGHAHFKDTEVGRIPVGWEVVTLGNILTVKYGKNQKEVENLSGIYPILGTGGLMGYADKFLYDKPSVLIGRKGTIDKPQYMDTPFWTVDTLFYTELNSDIDPKWLFQTFKTIDWKKYNEASGVPSLSVANIQRIIVPLPPLEEQKRIAEILSATDEKLEILREKKESFEELKKGLMQKLLTGEVRV